MGNVVDRSGGSSFSALPGMVAVLLLGLTLLGSSGCSADEEDFAPFTHERIEGPFPDGIRLGSTDLEEQYPDGLVDVTRPPFNADPSGKKDSTSALQQAIDFARNNQLVTYFPSGNYLVSDTLKCFQGYYPKFGGGVKPGRMYPNVLLGPSSGDKPTIVLAENSPGFGNARSPKYVVQFRARSWFDPDEEQGNIAFNQGIRGLDIRIGPGNEGAVGLRHRGAQGSFVQDVDVFAEGALKGMELGVGSGGFIADVGVFGGEIGIDMSDAQPAPVVKGVKLSDQKTRALIYRGNQSLTVLGATIESSTKGPLIETRSGSRPLDGHLALLDSSISFKQEAGTVFKAEASLYVANLYLKNANYLYSDRETAASSSQSDSEQWSHLREATYRKDPRNYKGYQFTNPVFVDGVLVEEDINTWGEMVAELPLDLMSEYDRDSRVLRQLEPPAVNIKEAPYHAKGDGRHDDTDAIKRAIQNERAIFFPKGVYVLSETLEIGKPVALLGVAAHLSVLSMSAPESPEPPPFRPVLKVNSSTGTTVMDSLSLHVPREIPNLFALEVDQADDVLLNNVAFLTRPILTARYHHDPFPELDVPLVSIRRSRNVVVNGFYQEGYRNHGPGYRHLSLRENPGPVNIYACNIEHAWGEAQMDIVDSSIVKIYGLKGEGNAPVLAVKGSSEVAVIGYGGNASALPESTLFKIENTRGLRLVNLTDSPRVNVKHNKNDKIFGVPVDPKEWTMVSIDVGKKGAMGNLDRPLLLSVSEKPEANTGL